MSEPVCNRCGRCCYYQLNGVWKKCRNLVRDGSRTSCRIWPNNVGFEIDKGLFCSKMSDHPFTYVGCPYNEGKPLQLVTIGPYHDQPQIPDRIVTKIARSAGERT